MNRLLTRCGGTGLMVLTLLLVVGTPIPAAGDAAATYKAKCAVCHGADGKGQTPTAKAMGVPDLTAAGTQNKTDAELTDLTAKGKGKMPGYEKSLSADDIKGLVALIRDLAKK